MHEHYQPNKADNSEQEILRWHFWFLVFFSAFLIVTFVFYLPQRFHYQVLTQRHDNNHKNHEDNHKTEEHHVLPDASLISRLPLYTKENKVKELSYIEKDGVKEFILEASEFRWEYAKGKWVHVWGYNKQIPGPTIRVNEGDRVRVIFKNNLPEPTTVHWHGVEVEWTQDGVPGITQEPVKPGEEFIYEFRAYPAGTHFYHTHGKDDKTSAQQLDMGLAGPFIIEPVDLSSKVADKEFIVVLDEWEIKDGLNTAISHIHGPAEGHSIPSYNTFTLNGLVYPFTEKIKVKEGESIIIRLINAGTDASHPMHLHGHNFEIIALDGNSLSSPYKLNTITLHPGETADILVRADNFGRWLFHCHNVHHAAAGMITLLEYEKK